MIIGTNGRLDQAKVDEAARVLLVAGRRIQDRWTVLYVAEKRASTLTTERIEEICSEALTAVLALIERTVEKYGKPVYKAAAEQAGFTFGMPDSPRKEAIKRMHALGIVPPA